MDKLLRFLEVMLDRAFIALEWARDAREDWKQRTAIRAQSEAIDLVGIKLAEAMAEQKRSSRVLYIPNGRVH